MLPLLLGSPAVTHVCTVARRELPAHPKLVHCRADLRDAAAREALGGVDVLWHLGFQLWQGRGRRDAARREMRDANLLGTANVIASGPGRIVLASSASVYGAWPDNSLPLRESAPPRANAECPYAEQKLEAEQACAVAAPTASLRIAAVLGPHADPLVRRASQGYRRGVPAVRGVRSALQFVHEDDAAAALLAAGMAPDAVVGPVNVATDDWLTAADIASVAGSRVLALPLGLLLRGSELARRARLLDFGADRAVLLNGPLALDCSRAAERLGWRPTRTSADVLKEFLGRP